MKKQYQENLIYNILISRTDRLGDVILTLPLIEKIKEEFPDSKVFFYADGTLLNC